MESFRDLTSSSFLHLSKRRDFLLPTSMVPLCNGTDILVMLLCAATDRLPSLAACCVSPSASVSVSVHSPAPTLEVHDESGQSQHQRCNSFCHGINLLFPPSPSPPPPPPPSRMVNINFQIWIVGA